MTSTLDQQQRLARHGYRNILTRAYEMQNAATQYFSHVAMILSPLHAATVKTPLCLNHVFQGSSICPAKTYDGRQARRSPLEPHKYTSNQLMAVTSAQSHDPNRISV